MIEYRVEGYSRDYYFKSIVKARAFAIKETMKEPRPYMDNGMPVMNYYPKWIDAVPFIQATGFKQQSGKAKNFGRISYIPEVQRFIWRPNRKNETAWIDKSGKVARRLTQKERNLYL